LAPDPALSQEEVLDQAFTIIRQQHEMDEWMLANRDEITAQIEQGYAERCAGNS